MKKNYILVLSALLCFNLSNSQNNCLNFDGTSDYVSTSLPTLFNNIATNDITIEALIYPEATVFSRILFAQFSTSSFVSLSYSANTIYFYVNNSFSQQTPSNSVPLNQWTHVACTWKASTQEILIYLNGILQTTVGGGSSSTGTNNIMTIGTRSNLAQFFDGNIDELRIWNTVRTQSQISANYNTELVLPQTNLVSYYKFNQGVAGANNAGITTLNDELNSNNGTLNTFLLNGQTSNWIGNTLLSNNSFANNSTSVNLFPNPSSDYISISGLKNEANFKIYDLMGKEIKTGLISKNKMVSIKNFSNGLYYLVLDNGKTLKFIKTN